MRWRIILAGVWSLMPPCAVWASPGPPCPGVTFGVDRVLVSGAPDPAPERLIFDDGGQVVTASGCPTTASRLGRRRGSYTVRARWPQCGDVRKVRLRAVVDHPSCTTMTGTVRAKGHPIVAFTATRLSGPTTTTTTLPGGGAGGLFEAANAWNTDISTAAVDAQSGTILAALASAGGWGNGNKFQIDFSLHLLTASATTPFLSIDPSPGYYTPDCDTGLAFPVPVGGAIEGGTGYTCDTAHQDCHLLVVDPLGKRLYEAYLATVVGSSLRTVCAIAWDLTRSYPANERGEQCTSADAAGLPMAALTPTADEVAAGEIRHAIRLILPNARMRSAVYVHPASHAGAPSGGPDLPPYGARLRLRADFDLATAPNEAARVILRAMQRYGLIVSDGGNIALTFASDRFSTATWTGLGIDSQTFVGTVAVTDFEVLDLGTLVPLTFLCDRNP